LDLWKGNAFRELIRPVFLRAAVLQTAAQSSIDHDFGAVKKIMEEMRLKNRLNRPIPTLQRAGQRTNPKGGKAASQGS
jgi:hypothetical protein